MSFRLVRQMVYALKRRAPLPVDVYYPGAPTINTITGAITQASVKIHVRKAVLLPDTRQREGRYDRTYVRESTDFVFGGFYDFNTRKVLIDMRDLNKMVPTTNCWIVYQDSRYEVKEVELHEIADAVILTCVRLQNALPHAVIDITVADHVDLSGEASGGV